MQKQTGAYHLATLGEAVESNKVLTDGPESAGLPKRIPKPLELEIGEPFAIARSVRKGIQMPLKVQPLQFVMVMFDRKRHIQNVLLQKQHLHGIHSICLYVPRLVEYGKRSRRFQAQMECSCPCHADAANMLPN